MILFTTFVLGGTTSIMLRLLGMIDKSGGGGGGGGGGHGGGGASAEQLGDPTAPESPSDALRRTEGGKMVQRFKRFDRRVLQPIFGGPDDAASNGFGVGDDKRGRSKSKEVVNGIELEPLRDMQDRDHSVDSVGTPSCG